MPASGYTILQNYDSRNIGQDAGIAPGSAPTVRYPHRLLQPGTERLERTKACAEPAVYNRKAAGRGESGYRSVTWSWPS